MELVNSKIEWIGDVPSDWKVYSLSQIVEQVKNKNKDLSEKNLLSLSYGKIKRKDIDSSDGLLPASFDNYNIIEEGDLVLRLTDLQNDHTSLRVGRATERGIITSAYCTLRPVKKEYSKFLYYLLHAYDVKKGFYGMGSGVRQSLNFSEVRNIKVVLPRDEDIERLYSYLDYLTEEIDTLIEGAKKTIDEYKAIKVSYVRETLSGKQNPDREFIYTGLEGIKEIPASWTKCRLRFLCDIMTGNQDTQNAVEDGEFPFYVRSPIVEKANVYTYDGEGVLMAGDGAGAGRVFHHATGKYAIHQRVYCFHNFKGISAKYFLYYMENMFPIVMDKGSAKSTVPSVRLPMIKDFMFCVPKISEQDDIVKMLDDKCKIFDELIMEKEKLIKDLVEYKNSVIFEIITGKKKVEL